MKMPLPLMNTRSSASHQGFTWIELLVVMAITGVLATLLIAAIGKVRNKGKLVKEIANFRVIGHALHSYLGEHNQVMPTVQLAKRTLAYHIGLLEAVSDWVPLSKSGTHQQAILNLFNSPYDDRPTPTRYDSYAVNRYMGYDMPEEVTPDVGILRYNEIVRPSRKLYYLPAYFLRTYHPTFTAAATRSPFIESPHYTQYKGPFPGLFVDGHVEIVEADPARIGTTANKIRIEMIMPRR